MNTTKFKTGDEVCCINRISTNFKEGEILTVRDMYVGIQTFILVKGDTKYWSEDRFELAVESPIHYLYL